MSFGLRVALVVAAIGGAGCGKSGTQPIVSVPDHVRLPPANPQAVAKMVQGVQASKEPNGQARALQLLREAITLDNGLWEARYDLGVLLAYGGNFRDAEEQLSAAAKIDPNAQDVAIALAEVRRRRGENKAASDQLDQFLQSRPNAIDARILFVATLRDSGQVDKAIVQAREVLVRRPADATGLAELALCHLAKGERDTASLLAKQALEANPKSSTAHRATGLIALAEGDDAAAFAAFVKASQENPRDTLARINMANVLLRAGSYGKAEEQYRTILQVAPDDVDALLGYAAAARGRGDTAHPAKYEEARGILEKILRQNPHEVRALFNLGVLYADFLKRPNDAKPLFLRFLSDASGDNPARHEAERYVAMLKTMPPGGHP